MHIYSYLFRLYFCKDYCHRVTTILQLVVVVVVVVVVVTAIHLSLGGCSPYTNTDETNKNKYA